jgi:hypothetical protein
VEEPSPEIKAVLKPARVSAAEEQENAKRVIKSSKKAVASMFQKCVWAKPLMRKLHCNWWMILQLQ